MGVLLNEECGVVAVMGHGNEDVVKMRSEYEFHVTRNIYLKNQNGNCSANISGMIPGRCRRIKA